MTLLLPRNCQMKPEEKARRITRRRLVSRSATLRRVAETLSNSYKGETPERVVEQDATNSLLLRLH